MCVQFYFLTRKHTGDEELDAFLEAELSLFHSFDDDDFVLKLKESDDDDVLLLIYV